MKEELMYRNILRWLWYIGAIGVLCLIFIIMMHLSIIDSDTLYIICMYIITQAIIVAVVLSILRKINMLTSWKAALYFAVVAGGGLAINFLLSPINSENSLSFSLSVFMLFVFLNFGLLEIVFNISFWKSCSIGVIAGLINALLVTITITCH